MKEKSTYQLTYIGLFATITFLGIQAFRIPLPSVVGVPFVHFGNIFLLLGALLLGGKKGALAGAIGFGLFDILNGYLMVMPKVIIIAVLMCLVTSKLFEMNKEKLGVSKSILLATTVAFTISLFGDFLYDMGMLYLAGSGFMAAAQAAFLGLFATFINSVFGVIAVTILYPTIEPIFRKYLTVVNKH